MGSAASTPSSSSTDVAMAAALAEASAATPAADAAKPVSGFDQKWIDAADYYIMLPRIRDARRNSMVSMSSSGGSPVQRDTSPVRGQRRISFDMLSLSPAQKAQLSSTTDVSPASSRRRRASAVSVQRTSLVSGLAIGSSPSSPSRAAGRTRRGGGFGWAARSPAAAPAIAAEMEDSDMVKLYRAVNALDYLRATIEILATMHPPDGASQKLRRKYTSMRGPLRMCASALMGSKEFWATLGCREVYLGGDLKWRYTSCSDFDMFQAWAATELDKIGVPASIHYSRWQLGDVLGHLGVEVEGARVRQTDLMPHPTTWEWPSRGARGLTPDELAYIYKLVASAIALNEGFQASVIEAVEGTGASHRATKPKSFTRMEVKCTTDHADDDAPRPAGNVDILRCALTYQHDEELIGGYRALTKYFGTVLRSKNGYSKTFDSSISHGYRALLINVPYSSGRTWGEIAADPVIEEALNTWWVKNTRGGRKFKRHWAGRQIMAHWTSEDVKDVEAKMVCEVQLMSQFYLDMRKQTHILYKVDRAIDWNSLMMDARPDNWYDGRSDFSAMKGGFSSLSQSRILPGELDTL